MNPVPLLMSDHYSYISQFLPLPSIIALSEVSKELNQITANFPIWYNLCSKAGLSCHENFLFRIRTSLEQGDIKTLYLFSKVFSNGMYFKRNYQEAIKYLSLILTKLKADKRAENAESIKKYTLKKIDLQLKLPKEGVYVPTYNYLKGNGDCEMSVLLRSKLQAKNFIAFSEFTSQQSDKLMVDNLYGIITKENVTSKIRLKALLEMAQLQFEDHTVHIEGVTLTDDQMAYLLICIHLLIKNASHFNGLQREEKRFEQMQMLALSQIDSDNDSDNNKLDKDPLEFMLKCFLKEKEFPKSSLELDLFLAKMAANKCTRLISDEWAVSLLLTVMSDEKRNEEIQTEAAFLYAFLRYENRNTKISDERCGDLLCEIIDLEKDHINDPKTRPILLHSCFMLGSMRINGRYKSVTISQIEEYFLFANKMERENNHCSPIARNNALPNFDKLTLKRPEIPPEVSSEGSIEEIIKQNEFDFLDAIINFREETSHTQDGHISSFKFFNTSEIPEARSDSSYFLAQLLLKYRTSEISTAVELLINCLQDPHSTPEIKVKAWYFLANRVLDKCKFVCKEENINTLYHTSQQLIHLKLINFDRSLDHNVEIPFYLVQFKLNGDLKNWIDDDEAAQMLLLVSSHKNARPEIKAKALYYVAKMVLEKKTVLLTLEKAIQCLKKALEFNCLPDEMKEEAEWLKDSIVLQYSIQTFDLEDPVEEEYFSNGFSYDFDVSDENYSDSAELNSEELEYSSDSL